MVSNNSILLMITNMILSLLIPLGAIIFFRKREKISMKPVFIGMLIFFVFSQILEKMLHFIVIGNNLISSAMLFSIYGAFAAGIFEEVGRFVAFKTVLKKNREWKDGIAYGLGHGGIEFILIGALGAIQSLIYLFMINNGTFDTLLTSNLQDSQLEQVNQLKDQLINLNAGSIGIGIAERIMSFGIQIALTMVVFYGIKYRKNIFLLIAVLLHALVDFPAALYQTKIITNVYLVEGFIAVLFVIAIIFLIKSKKIYSENLNLTGK